MNIDKYGRTTLTEKEALEAIYSNSYDFLNSAYFSNTSIVSTFNKAVEKNADNIPLLNLYQHLDQVLSTIPSIGNNDILLEYSTTLLRK